MEGEIIMLNNIHPKHKVAAALRLRGMKVLANRKYVIVIDSPSEDFKNRAVEIIENIKGMRRRCSAVQFHGITVRWNEE